MTERKLARGALVGFVRAEMTRRGFALTPQPEGEAWVHGTGTHVRPGRLRRWLAPFFTGRVDLAGARVKLEGELLAASRRVFGAA